MLYTELWPEKLREKEQVIDKKVAGNTKTECTFVKQEVKPPTRFSWSSKQSTGGTV